MGLILILIVTVTLTHIRNDIVTLLLVLDFVIRLKKIKLTLFPNQVMIKFKFNLNFQE